MRLIYSLVFVLALPIIVLRMLLRSRKAPEYRRRLGERLGFFTAPRGDKQLIWIHAVSLGETLAARPLIERMLAELPDYRLAITTTTPTGSAQVRRLFGDRVFHVYAPWDTPGAVQRCLQRLQPRLLLIMETELWPNLLHYADSRGCPVVLANARLSERSARGYARFAGTSARMLQQLSLIAAQNEDAAERFRRLGAPAERVVVTGSVKYDLHIDAALHGEAAELEQRWGLDHRPVVLAASTHEGEEQLVLEAFAALRAEQPQALLVLVPRHPERFDTAHESCTAAGWRVARRSDGNDLTADTDVLLIDSIGELLLFFGLADVAVIGGSFFDRGGHNPLEPAAWGKAVVTGHSMFNFEQIAEQLRAAGALEQVAGAASLATALSRLCADGDERERRGAAALEVVEENRGALERLFAAVREALSAAA